jgi:hypothetical protein
MNEPMKFATLEFTADTAGALEETRVSAAIVREVIKAVAKVISSL